MNFFSIQNKNHYHFFALYCRLIWPNRQPLLLTFSQALLPHFFSKQNEDEIALQEGFLVIFVSKQDSGLRSVWICLVEMPELSG